MLKRLIRTLATLRARVADDRGHVGVLMALVIFVVLGSLTMTWNTAQLSKEKMRLQNAADSAALGFCVWQARGMNTVQNLNDEMYNTLLISDKLLTFAVTAEGIAKGLDVVSALFPVAQAFAQGFHIAGAITGCVSGYLVNVICKWILRPLGYFYVYGSTVLGHWGAQQLAARNLADPLGDLGISWGEKIGSLGLYVVGLALPLADTVRLPLEQKDVSSAPWTGGGETKAKVFTTAPGLYGSLHRFFKTGEAWSFKPWVSKTEKGSDGKDKKKKAVLPGPSIWIARKSANRIEALPLTAWSSVTAGNGLSMFAVAAAQCVTGDVIEHSTKPKDGVTNQRPAGFGTGATAKLIPVSEALKMSGHETAADVVKYIIYH